jgi:transcriptional regulator GlxA family with amidase domain
MHAIGFVVFPNFYLLGFAAVTAFELANVVLGEPAYEVTVLSEESLKREDSSCLRQASV